VPMHIARYIMMISQIIMIGILNKYDIREPESPLKKRAKTIMMMNLNFPKLIII